MPNDLQPDFRRMIESARDAFARGALTADLPLRFGWMPEEWTAEEVRLARILVRAEGAEGSAWEYCRERNYPYTPGDGAPPDPGDIEALRAWTTPIWELTAGLAELHPHAEPDFHLYTLIDGFIGWPADVMAVPVTRDVAVLVQEGMADCRLHVPVPIRFLDRRRLLPALGEALAKGFDPWLRGYTELTCSHPPEELYRVFLAADGVGGEAWELTAEQLRDAVDPADGLTYDDLLALMAPAAGDPSPEAPAERSVEGPQVGWYCTGRGAPYVLCLDCGRTGRPLPGGSYGRSAPLLLDAVRPQPQSCHRCGSVMVEGILPDAPDRWHEHPSSWGRR